MAGSERQGGLGKKIAQRGTCRVCHYRFRLRRDGSVGAHKIYYGGEPERCNGSGLAPLREDV